MKYCWQKFLFLGFILFLLPACQKTLYDHFKEDTCDAKKWTNQQCRAAFRRGSRLLFGKEKSPGSGVFEVNYGILKVSEVDKEVKNLREDLKIALDYNNKGDSKFIDVHKLRPYLEHQEKVLEALDSSLQVVSLNSVFQSLTGLRTDYSQYGYNGDPHGDSYDLKKIFGKKDILTAYPFTLDQVEEARKEGKLTVIESFDGKLNRVLDRKVPDPQDPNDPKDENRFIWRPHSEWFSATNYKILDGSQPQNNLGNYMEIYRVLQGNKKESHPTSKIFCPYNNANCVMVLDTDYEGEPGFGLPDSVESINITGLRDIVQNHLLLSRLFLEKDRQERIKPNPKPVFAEVARVGQPMDMWEKSQDPSGWKVSFKYQNTLKSNYNVRIKLERDAKNNNDGQPPDVVTKIDYFVKEWTGSDPNTPSIGQVLEYFKPKDDFAQKNIAKIRVLAWENTKKVVVDFEDGREDVGTVTPGNNKYIESEPFAIEFTEGQKRWRIEKDANSSVFNKRKEVSAPKQSTGVY